MTRHLDLDALRHRSQVLRERLQQMAMVCQCGELIRDEGVVVFGLTRTTGRVITTHLHSVACPIYTALGASADVTVFATRRIPVTDWLIDPFANESAENLSAAPTRQGTFASAGE